MGRIDSDVATQRSEQAKVEGARVTESAELRQRIHAILGDQASKRARESVRLPATSGRRKAYDLD